MVKDWIRNTGGFILPLIVCGYVGYRYGEYIFQSEARMEGAGALAVVLACIIGAIVWVAVHLFGGIRKTKEKAKSKERSALDNQQRAA